MKLTLQMLLLLCLGATIPVEAQFCDTLWSSFPHADFSKFVISPNAAYLATVSVDKTSALLNANTGAVIGFFSAGGVPKFSPHSDTIYVVDKADTTITVYTVPSLQPIRKIKLPIVQIDGINDNYNSTATKCLLLSCYPSDGSGLSEIGAYGYMIVDLQTGSVVKYVKSSDVARRSYGLMSVNFLDSTDAIALNEQFLSGPDTVTRTCIISPNTLDTLYILPQLMNFQLMSQDGGVSLLWRNNNTYLLYHAGDYTHSTVYDFTDSPLSIDINTHTNLLLANYSTAAADLFALDKSNRLGSLTCEYLQGFHNCILTNDLHVISGNRHVLFEIAAPILMRYGKYDSLFFSACGPDPSTQFLELFNLAYNDLFSCHIYNLQLGIEVPSSQYNITNHTGNYYVDLSRIVSGQYYIIISNVLGSEHCTFVR